MLRTRLAVLAAAGALGLSLGCSGLSNYPTLYRLTHPFQRRAEPADVCGAPFGDGPIIPNGGPCLSPSSGPVLGPTTPLMPQNAVPHLAPPPRVVPQPQAEPSPYQPPP
jgi:hypothetical protein